MFDVYYLTLFIDLITFSCVRLAGVVSLIFLTETLLWSKVNFPASNLLNIAKLVVNELTKSISENIYQYFFFYPIYQCSMYKF